MWVKELSSGEKLAIATDCERFIADVLKPRFIHGQLDRLDHPLDIFGKWRGSKYGFSARYRSDDGEEFNTAFARLDHVEEHLAETRFDLMWYRHTGAWWRLHAAVTLDEALRLIAADSRLQPPL
ncbi:MULTISPECIES: hypothetical protein [Mesorhizobium]|uniref:Uncharacterized protein n=1 Tax=Mesorhizobium ciceri TaxID=39645 RepID=A0AB38TA01_9HYPH|nr:MULTISPECIES: hypothetical protein [Mesorhizobium]MDF3214098.1 hypothetical protein [Mesorhizobium ciceri]UTU51319.1 hypothetical protein LRP29_28275 [Mesorhizobium ciceri]